jgi:hypothetical protein
VYIEKTTARRLALFRHCSALLVGRVRANAGTRVKPIRIQMAIIAASSTRVKPCDLVAGLNEFDFILQI